MVKNKRRNYGSFAITLLVIVMLIISGPVSAVLVNVISDKTTYTSGDTQIVFDASVDIQTADRVPIHNLTFYVYNGSTVVDSVTFDPLGNIIGTSSNFTVHFTSGATSNLDLGYGYGYGAGYGYDSTIGSGYYFFYNGTGYDNGYGYGYQAGYGYGYGYGSLLRYNITWNLISATPSDGSYTGRLAALASDMDRYGYGYASSGYTTSHYYNSSAYPFTLSRAAVVGAPSIIGSGPSSPVTNIAGATRTFNITVNQTANVTWLINGTLVQDNGSVSANTLVNYTNTSAVAGFWNVTAVALNTTTGLSASQKWIWNVSAVPPGAPNITTFAPISPVSNNAGDSRTFNVTANQTVNVTWLINGSLAQNNGSVPAGTLVNYTNNSAVAGFWNVTAIALNTTTGLSASQKWDWSVVPIQPGLLVTSYWGNVTINNVLIPNANVTVYGAGGVQVASNTSNQNGQYIVQVPWVANETITFKVNGINATSRIINDAGTSNHLDLAIVQRSGVSLTADSASNTTVNYRSHTYILTINNTGETQDSYNLSVTNPNGAMFANLSRTNITNLAAGTTTTVRLDVGGAVGTYIVNVTATSQTNSSTTATVSTTTMVVTGPYITITSLTLNQSENGTATVTIYNTNFSAGVNVFVNNTPSVTRMTASKSAVEATSQFGNIIATVSGNESGWIKLAGIQTAPGLSSPVRVANLTYNATGNQGDTTALSLGLISLPNYTNGGAPTNELVTQAGILNGTLHIRDATPPVINNVTLNRTTVNASEPIHVTVNATDNVGVTSVTVAGGASTVSLTQTSTNIWAGDITAKSTSSTVTVTASDADGNTATDTSKSYTVVSQGVVGAPRIIGFAPATPVTNIAGETRAFNITMNQTVTVTWYINGTQVQTNASVTSASYTNTSAVVGTWNISAVALNNANGIAMNTWIWAVFPVASQSVTTDANGTVTVQVNLTAPDGNVSIVIPANTTVTWPNGTAITNFTLQAASVNLTGAMATAPSGMSFLGVNVDLRPDGARFNPPIRVRFNYTNAMVVGKDESSLDIRFYNTTSGVWDSSGIVIVERNTSLNYIIANVSHFSTFGLMGSTSVVTGGPSGGGTGTGGGGGVVSGEPFDNIAMSESYDKDLIANTPVTYTFKTPGLGIYEIAFTDKESENGITLRVEALKGTSKQVTAQPPGTVYKNINILAGTQKMKEALIRFKVENSWLGSNSLAGSDVKMLHWDGSQWTQIETAQTTKDDTYTYYEAKTTSLSPFAISGTKGGAVVATPTVTPTVTETPKPVTTAVTPPVKLPAITTWVYALIIIVIIAAVAYFFVIRKKEEKK